ncbi:hypothetical protein CK203_110026 [Vitis vinifera]|uniref:Uncharacterized protein n=1 Tax=Vitis vinifera TaxID=29760 RepID=A0A438FEV1_VITVI|nr:hypothetical protein CK203_110026 [Vitis vinifera]
MVRASSSWSRALVQISPSTFSVIGIAIGIGVSVLGAACLGTTLRALRYYLGGLELRYYLKGLRYYLSGLELRYYLKALRYYLSGLEGKSANHVSEVELGRATWTFLHTLAAQIEKYLTWIYLVILLKNGYFFYESLTEPILYKLDLKLSSHSGYVTCTMSLTEALINQYFLVRELMQGGGKLKCELRACYLQGTPDFGER